MNKNPYESSFFNNKQIFHLAAILKEGRKEGRNVKLKAPYLLCFCVFFV